MGVEKLVRRSVNLEIDLKAWINCGKCGLKKREICVGFHVVSGRRYCG